MGLDGRILRSDELSDICIKTGTLATYDIEGEIVLEKRFLKAATKCKHIIAHRYIYRGNGPTIHRYASYCIGLSSLPELPFISR
jgi:hypothetical protein